jgi:hypothetical protein
MWMSFSGGSLDNWQIFQDLKLLQWQFFVILNEVKDLNLLKKRDSSLRSE